MAKSNWPTHVWNPHDPLSDDRGMVPFSIKGPGTALLQSHRLTHDVYREHKSSISDSSIRAWDVMENPFYQAMAEYEGYDWDTLKAQFNEEVGPYESQSFRVATTPGTAGTVGRRLKEGGWSKGMPGMPTQYETFDNYAEAEAWAEENGYDTDDIELTATPEGRAGLKNPFSGRPMPSSWAAGGVMGVHLALDDDEKERFWGITDQKWVDRFNEWTSTGEDLIKKFKRQDAPIIRRGPSAADYGIVREDNNIFAHYGLDRPPAAPRELATNYKWNLAKTWTSDVKYAVPPDLKRVNLSGESNPILASAQTRT